MAQSQPPEDSPSPESPSGVVALVNGEPLLEAQLQWRWSQLPASRQRAHAQVESTGIPTAWRASLLKVLVDQELVQQYLDRRSAGASAAEVQMAFERWRERRWPVPPPGVTAEALTPRAADAPRPRADVPPSPPTSSELPAGWTESAVRRHLAWHLGWPRYVGRYLTEERLASYFAAHRFRFDGTRLRVAQILWRADSAAQRQELRPRVDEVYEALQRGQWAFDEAVERFSQSPTKGRGGEVGWIEWSGPMEPQFTRAAFTLQPGEMSSPVESPFGWHLIRCLERQAGERTLEQVREELRLAAGQELFRRLAARQRLSADIQILAP